jgi:hypothetical protein
LASLIRYLQSSFQGGCDNFPSRQQLTSLADSIPQLGESAHTGRDAIISVELPSRSALEDIFYQGDILAFQGWSYKLTTVSHALRHSNSLFSILAGAATSRIAGPVLGAPVKHHVPWLLDSMLSFYKILTRWECISEIPAFTQLERGLDLCTAYNDCDEIDAVLGSKSHGLLALICGKAILLPQELLSDDDHGSSFRRVFCLSLIQLVGAIAKYPHVLRLVKSQLLAPLETLVAENLIVGNGTDFWVS